MSNWTPLAVLAVALAGALAVALLEQLVGGLRPAPIAILRRAAALLDEPLSAPHRPDAWLYHLAPPLLLAAAMLALATVPWAPGFRGIDLSTGAILFSAALAYVSPAVFMAGWGSGAPLAVLGGFRFLALMLAYAMPLAMVVTAVAAPAASLRPTAIVEAQDSVPMLVSQPLAFVLFVPAAMAVALLPPFDLAHASAELGGGALGHYSGVHAALVGLAQRVLVVAVAGMTVTLFLAGWHGPLLPPAVWMVGKTVAVATLLLWGARRVPRPPLDWLVAWTWKLAIPAALGVIVWGGLVTLLFYR
ncbi:MAG: complex I subunit 1 family protein [Solirubrobacteraceae bacterium]